MYKIIYTPKNGEGIDNEGNRYRVFADKVVNIKTGEEMPTYPVWVKGDYDAESPHAIVTDGIALMWYGGDSRACPGRACNYMLTDTDFAELAEYDLGDKELYAEVLAPDDEEIDLYGYSSLKAEIIHQAKEMGIPVEALDFPYTED